MFTEYKPKKQKKIKNNNYIDDNDLLEEDQNESEEKKPIKKKTTKKKKAGTEIKSTKKNKLEENTDIMDNTSEKELTTKTKKKKKKKKKSIEEETKEEEFPENEDYNQIEQSINDKEEETKSKKKKKKKKKTIEEETKEEEIPENEDIKDSIYNNEEETKPKKKKKKKKKTIEEEEAKEENLTDYENYDKIEENLTENEEEKKPKKKKKKKKKTLHASMNEDNNEITNEDGNFNEYDIDYNRPKTSKPKKQKKINELLDYSNKGNKYDDSLENYDYKVTNEKSKKKQSKINDSKRRLFLKKLGRIINLNNTNQINLTKSVILNAFFTKNKTSKETDYEEEKKKEEKDNNNKVQETENDKNLKGSFADLLIKINDLDYQGYNYTLKNEDYFKRNPNGQPILTILNSEDAAIKKCEELMESLGNSKWLDPDFGPQPNDKGKGSKISIFGDLGSASSLNLRPEYIEWYTIKEINENATFFYDGTESNDVMQGALGDCWFISALSVIATKDYLLRGEFDKRILDDGKIDEEEIKMMSEGIYPPIFHNFATKGIYCLRFFKNFKWRYVLIDDRLPCNAVFNENQTKKLLFAHCRQDNEFWVPLIEKAYAKLHGSYLAIESGCIDDGLVDMTGLISKKVLKDNALLSTPTKLDELWKMMKEYSSLKFDYEMKTQSGKKITSKYYTRNKSMMGCSVEPNSKSREQQVSMQGHNIGIISGHAYSILDVFEIPKPSCKKPRKSSRLLRIKNPWGKYEWNGKWCDDSEEVIKNKERIENALKKKYEDTSEKIDFSQDDGTFLMRFSDFRKIFNNIFFCQNFPPNFIGVRFYDEWTKENSGGLPFNNTRQEIADFFTNPQYLFQLNKPGKIIINLLQNDGRLYGAKFPFEQYVKRVCLIVFKTKNDMPADSFNGRVDQTFITRRRDLSMELYLEKGQYIAIPSLATKGECTTFKLEFYFEDELVSNTKNNTFTFDQLKNMNIKRLGGNVKCELINEYIASEVKMTSKNKLDFIISAFQQSIKNEENNNKMYNSGFNFNQGYNDDEDF